VDLRARSLQCEAADRAALRRRDAGLPQRGLLHRGCEHYRSRLEPYVSKLVQVDVRARASLSILVVDDERVMRESCASYLEAEGYNVTVCSRGDKALETLKRRGFDIVLVDLYMSQVPGMELLRAALATHPESIVIVMTGNPSVDSSLEALRAGAWDYLPKPFSATHLQILIGRAAHAVVVARESRTQQQAQLEKPEAGESEKFNVLGSAPAFRKIIALAAGGPPPTPRCSSRVRAARARS
jgi:CheY-like chemotaxis protein